MKNDSLPSSVYEFREFLYRHPGLIREVREGKYSWNQLYQDWVVLGEDHDIWNSYLEKEKEESTKKEGKSEQVDLSSLMKVLNNINIQDLQKQISQFSGMMGSVQQVLQHFQKPSGPQRPPHDPFSFRGF